MRTIKFRGRDESGDWHIGCLVISLGGYFIYEPLYEVYRGEYVKTDRFEEHRVVSKTVGQFAGLLDKNGKEIFEGDILEVEGMYAKVVWNKEKASFEYEYLHPTQIANTFYEFNMPYLSIVGNIHDNPELIKEK